MNRILKVVRMQLTNKQTFVWVPLIVLGGAFAIYELLPAFLFGLFADFIVSLATPAPDQAVLNAFDAAGHKPEADHTAK